MTQGSASTITRADGVVEAQFDAVRVVLNEDLEYLGLDDVGQRVWDLLATPTTLDALVDRLTGEYDVEPARCRSDVARFIDALAQHKLVQQR